MKTRNLVLSLVLAAAFVFGMAGMASAAAISCGDCHSATDGPVDGDNCAGDARGLHGTHANYSSSVLLDVENKCDYCHTAAASTAPTATHNNNYINVTSTVEAPGLSWDGAGDTCTNACHKNNGNTAPWGNYTSPSVALSCASCHDDSSDNTGLGGAHVAHLNTNISTVSTLPGGGNGACDACHPDNTADWFSGGKADDGSVKAYPHASDGTNVVSDNAALDAGLSASRGAGATDTCANACHKNATSDEWGASQLSCNSCHYNTSGTIMGGSHNTHVVTKGFPCSYCHSVPGAGDTSHVTALPAVADNATVIADPGPNAGASWTDGTNTCSNTGTGCHGTSDAVWGTTLNCDGCHNYPGSGTNEWSGSNGHLVRYGSPVVNTHMGLASGYDAVNDDYVTVTQDTSKCGKCHYNTFGSYSSHQNLANDVKASGNNYCGAGDFTITVNTTGSDVTCSNVSCHSGRVTPNWW